MITMKTMMMTIMVAAKVPELMEPSLCWSAEVFLANGLTSGDGVPGNI